jgi:hypothetical protein
LKKTRKGNVKNANCATSIFTKEGLMVSLDICDGSAYGPQKVGHAVSATDESLPKESIFYSMAANLPLGGSYAHTGSKGRTSICFEMD